MFRLIPRYLTTIVFSLVILAIGILVGPANSEERSQSLHTDVGLIALTINDDGFLGTGFSSPSSPSCEYPQNSGVEHLYFGGIWVGAKLPNGTIRVSTSAEDANGLGSLNEIREFQCVPDGYPNPSSFRLMTTNQLDDNFDATALAPFHLVSRINDSYYSGARYHQPLGLEVELQALAWSHPFFDDFVILHYAIINTSASELSDIYVGYFNDTTVGNTNLTDPYDPNAPVRWNYYDDCNGAWRPGDLANDPDIWMMQEHDDDGDEGMASSWVGCRLLDTSLPAAPDAGQPPVSYNAWAFRHVPTADDWYWEPDEPEVLLPGKYQLMSNGQFDVGATPEQDFSIPHNWLALLSTGPFPALAPGDTLKVTFAVVCGGDQESLLSNSRVAKTVYEAVFPSQITAANDVPALRSKLAPNVPNPFNPSTRLSFTLAQDGFTRLSVHDLQGRLVATLINSHLIAGDHAVQWAGRDESGGRMASGTYLVRLESGDGVDVQKVVLVK